MPTKRGRLADAGAVHEKNHVVANWKRGSISGRHVAIFGHDAPKPADLPGEAYVVVGIYSWRRGRQLGWFFGSDRRARGNGLGARAFPRRFDGGEPIERGR